jgi:putative Flp pilus-assembly TadE/G-like protein
MRMKDRIWSLHRDERGVTLAFVAVTIFVLLGVTALAVDFGALYFDRRSMVNAADAASLAAAEAYALNEAQCGSNDAPAQGKADALATANVPSAQPDTRTGNSSYVVDCGAGTVTVQYYKDHPYFFAPALGIGDAQVAAKASAAWGPAGGAGGVLPVMVSEGRLSSCNIPGGVIGQDCYFYVNNGGGATGYGNASWALLNVQPDCGQSQFGWNVSVTHCPPPKVNPGPTYNCPSWGDSALRDLIANGSGQLSMDPSGNTYVCLVSGQHTPVFGDIAALAGKTRLFPVNDPNGQIKNGGQLCPPPNCSPDMWDIIGFIQMKIVEVLRGQPQVNWPAQCLALGPKDSNAWCLHAVWMGFTHVPGEICDSCENFGVYATQLIG